MPVNSEIKQYEMCPVCYSSIKTWKVKNMGNEKYNLDLCESCGYAFVNPRPSFSFLKNYYLSLGHDHGPSEKEAPNLESVLVQEHNEPNSIIDASRLIKTIKSLTGNNSNNLFLDVGCGYGFFSKAALGAGFEVIALELAENERRITKKMTGLNPSACSFEEFECASSTFQVILMSQILEHALDVKFWIKKAYELLVNDGIIAIALPNYGSIFRLIMQENDPYICPPAHLNYFNLNSLSKLLEKNGFKVEAAQWVSRIPKNTFEKRLPNFCNPLVPIISVVSSASLKVIDALHLSMMINVYGRKISGLQSVLPHGNSTPHHCGQ